MTVFGPIPGRVAMMQPSYVAEEAIANKQPHLGSQQSADGNLSMTTLSEYCSHDESSSSDQFGPRRLLEKNEEEDTTTKDLAMKKKKRTAISPLRRKNLCVTSPEESTNKNRSEQLLIADEASSFVASYKTKLYDAQCNIRDIRYNHIHKMDIFAPAPTETEFKPHGQKFMFRMDYDVEDDAFAYPGFNVGARLVKPKQAVHFNPVQDLRIGTLIQADLHKGLELRFEEGSNFTKFRVFVGDKFLVPPGVERAFLTNRSNTTSSIFIMVTIYAASQLPSKKAKVVDMTEQQDDASPVFGDMLYKGQSVVWYRPSYILCSPTAKSVKKYWNCFTSSSLSGGLRIPDFSSAGFSLPPYGSHEETSMTYARVYTVIHAPENGLAAFLCGGASTVEKADPTLAKRFALSSGDTFLVPPCNPTRFENNSKDKHCVVASTIIYVISYEDAVERLAEMSGVVKMVSGDVA